MLKKNAKNAGKIINCDKILKPGFRVAEKKQRENPSFFRCWYKCDFAR